MSPRSKRITMILVLVGLVGMALLALAEYVGRVIGVPTLLAPGG